jgi:hypothetical protein
MKLVSFLFLWVPVVVNAQDDLLRQLESQDSSKMVPVMATFKSTRVISGQSVENMKKNHLDFRISHRFGRLNSGAYQFFGLDQATLRLGLECGLTDDLMVGVGRSSVQKAYDFFGKYKLLKQGARGSGKSVSLSLFASAVLRTLKPTDPEENERPFQERLTYCTQLLLARKFSERFSLQVSPTLLYRNSPERREDERSLYATGIGARYKITKRVSVNGEYFWAVRATTDHPYYNSLALGVDIETGGHVFQLHFTNSLGMVEKQFIGETVGSWGKGDVHYGFNISRTFSLERKPKP